MIFTKDHYHWLLILLIGFPVGLFAQGQQKIKLLFVGDIMMHQPQLDAARVADTDDYDFTATFEMVKPFIKAADLAFGNLELTLPGYPPYKGWPNFRSPDVLARALYETGFDVLTTANNHSNDGRLKGVRHTIDVLKNVGFYQTGTFKDTTSRAANYPLLIYKKGFRLAVLNYTYGTDNKPNYPPTFVNKIDEKLIKEDIINAKKLKPDAIIAIMHWGREYKIIHDQTQKRLADKMLAWGVNIIIGSHPHVVQPILKKDAGTGQKVIAYSLGNFVSNQKQPNTDGGIFLEIELTKTQKEETIISDLSYTSVYRYRAEEGGKKNFYIIPVAYYLQNSFLLPKLNFKNRSKMVSFAERMRKHLSETSNCRERKSYQKSTKGITSLFN